MRDIKKNQVGIFETQNVTTDIKSSADGLYNRKGVTEERISEMEVKTIKTFQDEQCKPKRLKKKKKKPNRYSKTDGTVTKYLIFLSLQT
jgi:hypothetical protein